MTPTSPSEKVQSYYRDLSTAAINLNQASDEFGRTISTLDEALLNLNLGVSAWVTICGNTVTNGDYWSRDIGYAKVRTKWGIALRKTSGNLNYEGENDDVDEQWLFNDAPRWMRVESIDKIPDLLQKLIKQADETTARIKKKMAEAKELAAAIKEAAAAIKAESKTAAARK